MNIRTWKKHVVFFLFFYYYFIYFYLFIYFVDGVADSDESGISLRCFLMLKTPEQQQKPHNSFHQYKTVALAAAERIFQPSLVNSIPLEAEVTQP